MSWKEVTQHEVRLKRIEDKLEEIDRKRLREEMTRALRQRSKFKVQQLREPDGEKQTE